MLQFDRMNGAVEESVNLLVERNRGGLSHFDLLHKKWCKKFDEIRGHKKQHLKKTLKIILQVSS